MALSSNGQVAPENNLLTTIQRNLQDEELAEMESAIDTVIEADAVYDKRASQRLLQSLFSIKHSVNNLLDVSRQTLGELTRDMEALTEHYEQALQINLSLNYNQRRGYHFMLPMAERELAERGGFIQLHAHGKKSVSCSTEELAQLNMRCQDMISQILMTTEQARLAADESGGKVSSGSCTHTRACVSEGTCKKRALYRTVGARRAHRVHPVALACTLPIERECRSA
jgi:DNA mismatch repair ATPase MutS